MKKVIVLLILMTFLSINHLFAGEECLRTAMTQTEMNKCANIGYKEADSELNRVYKLIKEMYSDDEVFLEKLKIAQRAWIKLRDADFELQYPHKDERGYYGSVFPMCEDISKTELTLQRVAFLKRWLVGTEEGDVCSGSLMFGWRLKEAQSKLSSQPK